jgi:hypothetical protein
MLAACGCAFASPRQRARQHATACWLSSTFSEKRTHVMTLIKEQQTTRVALLLVHDVQQVTSDSTVECFIAGWPMGRCSASARARCTQLAPADIAHWLQNSAAACQQASAANDAQHATWSALYSTSFAPAHHPGGRCWLYRGKIPAHALHTCWCSPQLHSKPLLGGTAPRAPWRHAWHGIVAPTDDAAGAVSPAPPQRPAGRC